MSSWTGRWIPNIGRAISLAFAREGAHVTIAEIDAGQGEKTAGEARKAGAASAVVAPTDVTKLGFRPRHRPRCRGAHRAGGRARQQRGLTLDRLFVEKERTEWEKEVQLNLWGMINCTRAVLDGMIARKGGAIVSMGSDAGRMGEFREAVYGACKAGVIALTKSLACEVGHHGIRLNVVCPGMTMPSSEEEFGDLSMWAAEVNRAWGTPEMQARIAKAYPLRRIGERPTT